MSTRPIDVEQAVRERYSEAARRKVERLCCAVTCDPALLDVIPDEILERDYGCGDPTRHLRRGETVLDLGSGGGKACYIAAQVVGREGRVIGIDMNDEMLALAEKHREGIARRIGFDNVSFHKGRIQDLGPMLADASVDVVVSNCVLNLVRPEDRPRLFSEVHRVLRDGGRAVIADIVGSADVPPEMRADPELWSGCISGAFREDRFVEAFKKAGFGEVVPLERDEKPWRVIDGIEFRSVTVEAVKPGSRLLPR